jgi:hypothetical protein
MPTSEELDRDLRCLARQMAQDWLLINEYCDCAIQLRLTYRYFLPIATLFSDEMACGCELCIVQAVEGIFTSIERESKLFERYLHRPGQSAAIRHTEESGYDQ